jgi:hypothetical protein
VSGPIFEAVGRAYADWPITAMDDEDGYAVDVEGSDGAWSALVIADDDNAVFCFYSLSPVDVDVENAEAMARMAEFVDRANLGLVAATFELDHDTGEVRVRSGLELGALPAQLQEDPAFIEAIALDLSAANIRVMDQYLAGIIAVAAGSVDVADVVAEIESDTD